MLAPIQRDRSYVYIITSDVVRTLLLLGAYWYCGQLLTDISKIKGLFDWMNDSEHSHVAVRGIYHRIMTTLDQTKTSSCLPFLACSLGLVVLSVARIERVLSIATMLFSGDVVAALLAVICAAIVTTLTGFVRSRPVLSPVDNTAEVASFLQTMHRGVRIEYILLPYVRAYLYSNLVWTVITWVVRAVWWLVVNWSGPQFKIPAKPVRVTTAPRQRH